MKIKNKPLLWSLGLALVYYFLDALFDHLLFYDSGTFIQSLITAPPVHEISGRVLGMGFIILLGILIPELLRPPRPLGKKAVREDRFSGDPALMVHISNEIRTPLNAIMGFVDLLKDEMITPTSQKLYLDHIQTSGKYLLELMNNITDITLIETGNMYISREECRVNQLLQRLENRFREELEERKRKGVEIRMVQGVKDEWFTVFTDEVRLYQILANLLENAVEFTRSGRIEFGYDKTGKDELEFFVTDTGAGLSPDRINLLFPQSGKLGSNLMRPFDIVSLRINIVRELVQLFGSELIARSSIREGSDFRFRLTIETAGYGTKPMKMPGRMPDRVIRATSVSAPESVEAGAPKEGGTPDEKAGKEARWAHHEILIAEDTESNYFYLKEILKPTGVKILWAKNGKEAVEMVRSNPGIELILMDILMPEMDGYEAARTIKKKNPGIPVIAQTAYNIDEDEYKEALKYFVKFMIKPIWSIDLLSTLSQYLDKK